MNNEQEHGSARMNDWTEYSFNTIFIIYSGFSYGIGIYRTKLNDVYNEQNSIQTW